MESKIKVWTAWDDKNFPFAKIEGFEPTNNLKNLVDLCENQPKGADDYGWVEAATIATKDGLQTASERAVYEIYTADNNIKVTTETTVETPIARIRKKQEVKVDLSEQNEKTLQNISEELFGKFIPIRKQFVEHGDSSALDKLVDVFKGYKIGENVRPVKSPFGVRFEVEGVTLTACVWVEKENYCMSIYNKLGKRLAYKTRLTVNI